jgi:diguanylate cyclase (GGDEF)-like protein/putative nucleotidyltransferase with HDIG domain
MGDHLEEGVAPPAVELRTEARETSGMTSALLLEYVERAGGHDAVASVLRRCGLEGAEAELRDENAWFSWETKIALFEATAAVLDKPEFLTELAVFALDANIGGGLKVALRTLGSPQFVVRNIVRANARFNRSHVLELLELDGGHARLRFAEIGGGGRSHRLDCEYTAVMVALIPMLFGLPPAQVTHSECAAEGAEACILDLRWTEHAGIVRRMALTGVASVGALVTSALLLPVALPGVGAAVAAAAGLLLYERERRQRERWRHLERQVDDSEDVADRLFASLQDLVSDLRLEEVVGKVTRNAQAAVGGREFMLLVREGDGLVCQSSSGLPGAAVAAVEAWANGSPRLLNDSVVLDDVGAAEALTPLVRLSDPLRSLASSPLHSFGEAFGLLVALGGQQQMFLPRDISVLESYAAQVAIALSNARQYQTERSLAASDPLTGLLNHRSFHEALDAELDDCARTNMHSSVVLIDLDCFKQVNDEDGHAAGDRMLRAAARALTDVCRRDDLAFRIGGDEFALLLSRLSEREALEVASRVCDEIAALDERLGASAGVATVRPGERDKDALLAQADRRLYAAKRGERRSSDDRGVSTARLITPELAVEMLVAALELHDRDVGRHCTDVAELAVAVAERLGCGRRERELVRQAALVHDLGKLAIPPELLAKPGPLNEREWELMREHPDHGADVLLRAGRLDRLAAVVRACHERWDGGGYPNALRGDAIPFAARVVAVCDAYAAMIEERPYRPVRTRSEAVSELRACAGSHFDPSVVQALVAELSATPAAR